MKGFRLAGSALLLIANLAHADALSGQVSFDPSSDLYTYTYTLDTSQVLGAHGVEIGVLVDQNFNEFGDVPAAHTEPAGWQQVVLTGIIPGSKDLQGTSWGWWTSPLPMNQMVSFGFSTDRAPSTDYRDNYWIFSPDSNVNQGFFEIGHIVGPAVLPAVPEPASWALLLLGAGALLVKGRRQGSAVPAIAMAA